VEFKEPLLPGVLIKRYKRFLADVKLKDGTVVTAHCPNSGSMRTCDQPGWEVRLSRSANPRRKLQYTWEMVHNGKCWIGINTILANKIVVEAITKGIITELQGYSTLQTERKYGTNSRIDVLLSEGEHQCFVEIKNVTLVEEDGFYRFPDAVTKRGLKHLHELMAMVDQGHCAALLFAIQRTDGTIFKPADHIDPAYGQALRKAHARGVKILPYLAEVSPQKIEIIRRVDYSLE